MRRLAARLVPRFLPIFPSQMSYVASMLIGLHQSRYKSLESDVDSVIASAKTDVLKGLGSCLDTASRADTEAAIPALQSIVDFLLR